MRTSLHIQGVTDPGKILRYYDLSGAKVAKFVNIRDRALFAQLKARGVTIVYRLHTDNQKLGGSEARDFIRALVKNVAECPEIDYAEGYNEEFAGGDEIARYAEFEIERMQALEAIGKKAIIGCFSCGTPEITDHGVTWSRFLPALKHALPRGHALGLHEYAGPYMQYFTHTPDGANQWDEERAVWTGISADPKLYWNPKLTGWLTLRYRMVYALLAGWGLADLPLFITEGGIDDTTPRPGPPGKGYKAFQNGPWDRLPGIGDYADQRYWYMWQASHDRYVKGVTDFGWEGTATGWPDFDLATDPAMVDRLIQLEAVGSAEKPALPVGWFGNAEPPPPPPPEVTMYPGIDVSRWQGQMDWPKARGTGPNYQTGFALIKATEGSAWVDPQYSRNAASAAAVGILFGPYHFFKNGIDPLAQARHFYATVMAAQVTPGVIPALDFEDSGRADPAAMATFAAEVERLFRCRPMVYTARWWWTAARLGGPQAWAARLPLWCADYSGPIDLPATGEWSQATIHQYTSSGHGPTYGAQSAAIDLDRFSGTRDGFLAVVGYMPPPSGPDQRRLFEEARERQEISPNPDSALLKRIKGDDGMMPISDEWDFSPDEIAQYAWKADGNTHAVFVWDRRSGSVTRYDPI